MTIETRRGTGHTTVRYPLGPATALPELAPEGSGPRKSGRAYWRGTSLVTEGTSTIQGQTVSIRETRTLDGAGAEMTLETLLVVQHGYTLKGAQNYGAAKDVYRKTVPPRD